MRETISIVLIDDNKSLVKEIESKIEENDNLKIIGVAFNGEEGLKMIENLSPDLVVIDIVMPMQDGLYVLEKLNSFEKIPKIIMLSSINNDNVVRKVIELGADYFITKPVDIDSLISRIKDIGLSNQTPFKYQVDKSYNEFIKRPTFFCLETEISILLNKLGVPAHIKGYSYLREAISLAVSNPYILNKIIKELYPSVAEKHNTTPQKVERGIRHAIEVACKKGNVNLINSIFSYKQRKDGSYKPTNSEFVATLTERIKAENKDNLSA